MAQRKPKTFSVFPLGIILLSVAAVLCAFVAALILKHTNVEPLADATSLQRLERGLPLSIPQKDSFATFHDTTIDPPAQDELRDPAHILGVSDTAVTKRIEVDLTRQRVYAIEQDRIVHEFIVSTGKWGW